MLVVLVVVVVVASAVVLWWSGGCLPWAESIVAAASVDNRSCTARQRFQNTKKGRLWIATMLATAVVERQKMIKNRYLIRYITHSALGRGASTVWQRCSADSCGRGQLHIFLDE